MLNTMRKTTVMLLAVVMLLPSTAALAPSDDGAPVTSRDPETMPAWLQAMTPLPSRAEGRIFVVPPAETQDAISKMTGQVSREYITSYLTQLQGYGSRYVRAPGMYNATKWLYGSLLGNGRIQAELQNWSYVNASGVTHWVSNVVLTLPGVDPTSDRVYYLFNHDDATLTWPSPTFDDLMTDVPGVDDDGTGVAATLEAARVLSRYSFQDTIRFAFFNGEEMGLVGSQYWAEVMYGRGERVPASIDFDMIGTSPGNQTYDLVLESDPGSYGQVQYMMDVSSRYDLGLSIYPVQTTGFIPSDISAFYAYGFPGVMGIEYSFSPNYHRKSDRLEFINTSLVARCSKLAVASLSEMARLLYVDVGIPPGEMTASNLRPDEGDQVTLKVNITNTGNLNASNLEVAFYADGIPFISKRISVPANGTNTTSAPWSAVTGNHRISVVLDPNNEMAETDKTNNTANITIYVNDRPRAVLAATPLSALTNESVLFNGSLSTEVTGVITAYNFTFGDGAVTGWVPSPTAAHSYPVSGSYTATLVVRDSYGAVSNIASVGVRVLNRGPTASPSSDQSRVLTFEPVQFWSNATDPEGPSFVQWDFGDRSSSSSADPVHNYSKSGDYEVLLSVRDDEGATANYSLRVLVDDRPPVVDINASNMRGTIETEFAFSANASDPDGTIASYLWDLGDGSTSKLRTVKHSYARPGSYLVLLTVKDDDGSEVRDIMNITVANMPPSAVATCAPVDVLTFQAVQFDGRKSLDLEGPVTFLWDLGDGNTSASASLSHSYSRPGDYNTTLTVTDSAGSNSSVSLPTVHVRNRSPKADFRYFGCFTQNGTVYFDATGSTDPEGPVTFRWSFGDGASAQGPVTDHIFPGAGNYTVNVTVTDIDGQSASMNSVVQIFAPPPPPPKKHAEPAKDDSALVMGLSVLSVLLLVLLIVVAIWAMRRRPKEPELMPAADPAPPPEEPRSAYSLGAPHKVDFSAQPRPAAREAYAPGSVREEYAPESARQDYGQAYSPQAAYEPGPVYEPEPAPPPEPEPVQEEVRMEYAPPPPPQKRPVAPPARGATARSPMQSLDDLLRELQK